MKRHGNLYNEICSMENLMLAFEKASKGKAKQPAVILYKKDLEANILALHHLLINGQFRTGRYSIFTIKEPKERIVYRLPFQDRIVHHAIMNIVERIFVSMFTADTYSCIKGRGIHSAARKLAQTLKDLQATQYCLKLDIKKFYPSVDHDILKRIIRRKIKDAQLLRLLDEIIDSAPGLPIGNYLSQHFANLYLTGFDHWLKEAKGIRHYFRYADDIVILNSNKPDLHRTLGEIQLYLQNELKLTVKSNYQIFPVAARGIDFLGYKFYHTHILLRKSIKKNFARKLAKKPNALSIASYMGWAKYANTKNLLKKLMHEQL